MNNIDFSNLPHKKQNGKMMVDWKKVKNEEVTFEYNGKSGVMTMTYSYSKGYIHFIECFYNNKSKKYSVENIKKCKINSLVQVDKNNFSSPTPENWLYQRNDLHKFVDNPEDLKNYHMGSGKYYNWKCPSCGKRFNKRILDVTQYGMSCDLCSSSFSKNERLVSIILTKMGEYYETQKEFKDCKIKNPLPFDFYLPQYNMVIETHGLQHYKEVKFYKTNEHTLVSDKVKKSYCKDNNIRYCEINCSSGKNVDTIKQLKKYVDINLTEEELKECMWESMHNINEIDVELISNLYNSYWGQKEIEDYMGLKRGRVSNVLENLGKDIENKYFSFNRSLINLVNGKIYGSISHLKEEENVKTSNASISRALNRNHFIYNSNGDKLCITRRRFLSMNHDKSNMSKLYRETMSQLNKNKDCKFDKFINKNIDDILDESKNQREDMLLLNNLPSSYYIKNNIIYRKDL